MNLMTKAIGAGLLGVSVTLGGCALLDSLMLEPLTFQDGSDAWIDVEATESLPEDQRDAGAVVLVKGSDRIPGRKYERAYKDESNGLLPGIGNAVGSNFGAWGAIAGPIGGIVAAVYAAIRGRRKFSLAKAGQGLMALALVEFAKTMQDMKDGKIDTDADGKVALNEISAYIAKRGKDSANPEFIKRVVEIALSSMVESDKQKKLEELADEFGAGV